MGIKVYDALIANPDVLDNDGGVRIKYEFPMDASGAVGDNGWYRSDATVSVSASGKTTVKVAIEGRRRVRDPDRQGQVRSAQGVRRHGDADVVRDEREDREGVEHLVETERLG